jgi:membrane dipeptidase
MKRIVLLSVGAFILLALALFFFVTPLIVDWSANGVYLAPGKTASPRALALCKDMFIADLHCDALMWDRDLLDRHGYGHVDIPRLIEGGVALETFSIVSKAPLGMFKLDNVTDKNDTITLLAVAEGWPPRAWTSLLERALYQSDKMRDAVFRSNGQCFLITSKEDLEKYLVARGKNRAITAGLLSIEGAQVLEGDPDNVEALYKAGFRMMSPTHFFDNEMSGSAHGVRKGGLTEKGKAMVRLMEQKGMIVDLAHASPRAIDDILAMATKPVVVSHTGVFGVCGNVRNISDRHIRAIAAAGGVIGIAYFPVAVCGESVRQIIRSIRYTVERAGVDHVALGSDYDGSVTVPFDTTGVPHIADALLSDGFTPAQVRLIMGGNVLRLLRQVLPAK